MFNDLNVVILYDLPVKAVILCGGKGSRLAEETKLTPKPLVRIGGIPIVCHIINYLMKFGINQFYLAVGYLGDEFVKFFSNENQAELQIIFQKKIPEVILIDTGLETMTGGRVKKVVEFSGIKKDFILTYGDGVANIDIQALISFHNRHSKIATISAVRPPARFGVLRIDENNFVKYFKEKLQTDSGWINGGFFILNPDIVNYIDNDESVFEDTPIERLVSEHNLVAFKHEGFWQCMDTLRDKEYLEQLWESGNAPWI